MQHLKSNLRSSSTLSHRPQAAFTGQSGFGRSTTRTHGVVCMAHPRRVAKVAKQIEREVGQLLISDKTVQAAVCPERRRGYDGALSALASVTEVRISNDLQVAKVYLSIYSDEAGKAAALDGLQRLEGYVRKHIGKQVRLRLTPEIRFVQDDSIERSERIYKLLEQAEAIERGEAEPPPLAFYGDEDGEWEEADEGADDAAPFDTVDLGLFDEQQQASSSSSSPSAQARPQQQQQTGASRRQRHSRDAKEDVIQDDKELEAMLASFKRQVEQRQSGKH